MSTATQRKAWNEAMRSAGAVIPGVTSAGSSGAAGPSRRGGVASRAADRRRNKRRDKARKSSSAYGGADGGVSSLEEREYRVALHMDMLEGVAGGGAEALDEDDDDEYDEFAELEDDDDDSESGNNKSKAKKKRKRKGAGGSGGGKKGASSVPKYLKARSLASILMEEASRPDSVAKQYVDASVRRLGAGSTSKTTTAAAATAGFNNNNNTHGVTRTTYKNPYPARKFCPVTGLFGEYTEPKTGIPYASLSALEQIRERPPPWMNAGSGSSSGMSASYWEAVRSLQNNG